MPTIDENSRQVGLGMVQGTRDPLPIQINPANGKLQIEIIPVASIGTFSGQGINIDENSRQVSAGISDDANQNIIPLSFDYKGAGNPFPLLRIDVTLV